jgi:hypothetical protein
MLARAESDRQSPLTGKCRDAASRPPRGWSGARSRCPGNSVPLGDSRGTCSEHCMNGPPSGPCRHLSVIYFGASTKPISNFLPCAQAIRWNTLRRPLLVSGSGQDPDTGSQASASETGYA